MIKQGTGFTLIELVIIIVILGILSAYFSPRLNFVDHAASGCAETVKASFRLGQKLAIAKRKTPVTVSVTNDCAVTVDTESYTALNGVSVTNSGSVTFNGQGQPFMGGTPLTTVRTFIISGSDVLRFVCLEAETGYVHEEVASCG